MASGITVSVVVVGDSKIGKTALIRQFTNKTFTEDYVPTNFDKLHTTQDVEQHRIEFVIWDTSGSPSHDSIRSLSYQDADVFLLCYKISDPDSLYNVKNKWIREIRSQKFNKRHQPHVVLCGCQADLRSDPKTLAALGKVGRMPTSSEQALAICCEIGAVNYVETSSLPDTIDKRCGYEGAREAFEVCALAVMKTSTLESNNVNPDISNRELSKNAAKKENKQHKSHQSKRKSILMSPSKFGQDCNVSLRSDSVNDITDPTLMTRGISFGMSTTSSKKSISSNSSSHASKKSSSFSGHNVSFGSGCGVKSEIDSILEYPASTISSRLSAGNNIPCQYVSVNSHQELHQSSIKQIEQLDSKDSSIVKMIHNDGSFSNLPKLPYHRNTNSPKLKNRQSKDNCNRNIQGNGISQRSLREFDPQRIQQRALSFGSSHSSFSSSSPQQKLSISSENSSMNKRPEVPIRIESDDIILLTRGNVNPLRESQDANMVATSSNVSSHQQTPQAQVRSNGLSRRTSFRSQPQYGNQKPLPVSTPKSPLLMNGDMTASFSPQQQLTVGALAGPQVPSILKRTASHHNRTPSIPFQKCDITITEQLTDDNQIVYQPSQSNIGNHVMNSSSSQPDPILQQYKSPLTSTLASQGSAGSKTSTASSMASSTHKDANLNASLGCSSKLKIPVISETIDRENQLEDKIANTGINNDWLHSTNIETDFSNTENPNLLSQLQFVSPKTGVFRPVSESASISTAVRKSMSLGRGVKLKKRDACSLM